MPKYRDVIIKTSLSYYSRIAVRVDGPLTEEQLYERAKLINDPDTAALLGITDIAELGDVIDTYESEDPYSLVEIGEEYEEAD